MKRVLIALALIASPAMAQEDPAEAARAESVAQAISLIQAKKPGEAIEIFDRVIREYQSAYAEEKSTIFCGHNTETLLYLTGVAAAADKGVAKGEGAIAVGPAWCLALWGKGFALIDEGKVEQAVPFLQRAVDMAPAHSHYLSELAYAYQALKQWDASLALYRQAEAHAGLAEEGARKAEQGRALRGIGFDLVELGRWDEAAEAYRKALKINPDDKMSQGELQYVAEHQKK